MSRIVAIAIMQMLLNAGAPKSEVSLDCHTLKLRIRTGKTVVRKSVEACQVFVTKDHSCQATFDFKRGAVVHCSAQPKLETL